MRVARPYDPFECLDDVDRAIDLSFDIEGRRIQSERAKPVGFCDQPPEARRERGRGGSHDRFAGRVIKDDAGQSRRCKPGQMNRVECQTTGTKVLFIARR